MMEQLTKREEEVMNKFWEKGEASFFGGKYLGSYGSHSESEEAFR